MENLFKQQEAAIKQLLETPNLASKQLQELFAIYSEYAKTLTANYNPQEQFEKFNATLSSFYTQTQQHQQNLQQWAKHVQESVTEQQKQQQANVQKFLAQAPINPFNLFNNNYTQAFLDLSLSNTSNFLKHMQNNSEQLLNAAFAAFKQNSEKAVKAAEEVIQHAQKATEQAAQTVTNTVNAAATNVSNAVAAVQKNDTKTDAKQKA